MIKKILGIIVGSIIVISLSACQNQSEKTEDTTEASKILAKGIKQQKAQEKQALEDKKKRINTENQFIQVTGEIVDTLTKPESGVDIYQLTVKVHSVSNDVNHLYTGGEEREYVYFVSPTEFPEVDFSTLKKGETIKIETFQDAYMTENIPKQIGESDIVKVMVN